MEATKHKDVVTPREKSAERDTGRLTQGREEAKHGPICQELCPHPVSKYCILLAADTGVVDARERNTTGGQAHCGGRVRWGDAAQGGDGTRRGRGMPTKRSVFEGGALPWSGRWCMEENNKVQKLYLYR